MPDKKKKMISGYTPHPLAQNQVWIRDVSPGELVQYSQEVGGTRARQHVDREGWIDGLGTALREKLTGQFKDDTGNWVNDVNNAGTTYLDDMYNRIDNRSNYRVPNRHSPSLMQKIVDVASDILEDGWNMGTTTRPLTRQQIEEGTNKRQKAWGK